MLNVRLDRDRGHRIAAIERQRFVEEGEQRVERLEVSGLAGAEMLDTAADTTIDQVGFFAELDDEGSSNRRERAAGVAQL
jgi:hypothetical protein